MNMEDRLRDTANSPVDQPAFSEITHRVDRRRRLRRAGGAGALAAVVAVGAMVGLGLREDEPQTVSTNDVTPAPIPTAAPDTDDTPGPVDQPTVEPDETTEVSDRVPTDATVLEAGPDGIVAVGPSGATVVYEGSAAAAYAAADALAFQEPDDPNGAAAEIRWRSDGVEQPSISTPSGGQIRLHGLGMWDGEPAALVATSQGNQPDDFSVGLTVTPLGGGEPVAFDVDGGWENTVSDATWDGDEFVAVLMSAELQVHAVGGPPIATLPVAFDGPDAISSIVWVQGELWGLRPVFGDDGSDAGLRILRFDPDLNLLGDAVVPLVGHEPQAGFCAQATFGSDGLLWCDQSSGPAITIEPGTGATAVVGTQDRGFRTPVIPPLDQPAPGIVQACDNPADLNDPSRYRLYADLDGDGQAEAIDVDDGTPLTVTVCDSLTVGTVAEIGTTNDPGSLIVLDVEGDGVDELVFVAPTGSRPLVGSVHRLVDGELTAATEGFEIGPPLADADVSGASFRCDDGDGVVPMTYEFAVGGPTMEWVDDDAGSGSFDLSTETVDAWLLASGTCGNVVVGAMVETSPVQSLLIAATQDPPLERVVSGGTVELGLDSGLVATRTAEELTDPSGWVLDVDIYNGWGGPFSALDVLAAAQDQQRRLQVTVGPHDHCASPPVAPPPGMEDLTQLSIQPTDGDSCIQWFSVNLFVEDDFTVRAITLELWEP